MADFCNASRLERILAAAHIAADASEDVDGDPLGGKAFPGCLLPLVVGLPLSALGAIKRFCDLLPLAWVGAAYDRGVGELPSAPGSCC